MKILLINPPSENTLSTELPSSINQERGCNPYLGILYVAAVIRESGKHDAALIDAAAEKLSYKEMEKKIRLLKPDAVGITVMSFTLIDCILTSELIKRISPSIKVIWGGPHVNIYPEESILPEYVDYVVLGEGESNIVQLLDAIGKSLSMDDVPGIIYKEKNSILKTRPNDLIGNLDEVPFPARDMTDIRLYNSLLSKSSSFSTMVTSRGCPYGCTFCNRPYLGKIFRPRSYRNTVDEMEECVRLGIAEIMIYDDTFTVERQRVVDICGEIIKRKLKLVWYARARVDTVDYALLKLMRKAGCKRMHYGVESGNQRILNTLRKGITLEQAEEAVRLTKKAGMETLAYFMIGSPGETKETVSQTIGFAKRIGVDFCHFTVTTPFPTTPLYEIGLKEGIIDRDCWKEFADNPMKDFVPRLWTENLSAEELHDLTASAYKQFYIRPAYIAKRILDMRSFGELNKKVRAGFRMIRGLGQRRR